MFFAIVSSLLLLLLLRDLVKKGECALLPVTFLVAFWIVYVAIPPVLDYSSSGANVELAHAATAASVGGMYLGYFVVGRGVGQRTFAKVNGRLAVLEQAPRGYLALVAFLAGLVGLVGVVIMPVYLAGGVNQALTVGRFELSRSGQSPADSSRGSCAGDDSLLVSAFVLLRYQIFRSRFPSGTASVILAYASLSLCVQSRCSGPRDWPDRTPAGDGRRSQVQLECRERRSSVLVSVGVHSPGWFRVCTSGVE